MFDLFYVKSYLYSVYSPSYFSMLFQTFLQQRAFATESQLHLAQKELNKLKEQLQTAETTRAQALTELEKAKKTVLDLTLKLTTINESKEQALKAAEAAKAKTTQLNDESNQDGNPNGKLDN